MRVRSIATGEVIDIAEEGATILIDAGLYELVSDAVEGDPPPLLTKMAKPITSRRRRA